MYCWCAENSFAICSFSASGNDFCAMAGSLSGRLAPPEPGLGRSRLHRARGHAVGHRGVVVPGRRHVVGGVGMEQRGEVLNLAPARPYLALTAAVDRDPLELAVVVHRRQLTE